MIELGPLAHWLPDTGLTRINIPGGGLIEPVTASARSRLGQRITFACQDETHAWVASNNGHWLADNQRRNLSGTGGRFLETTNAFAPEDDSVAGRTQREPGVFVDDVDGGAGSIRNKEERRRVMRKVYGHSLTSRGGWVDLDRIDVEIEALIEHDPAQAERFFLNRKLAAHGAAFDIERWDALRRPRVIARGETIAIGVDGARFQDALAVVATHVRSGYQWPLEIVERPLNAPEDYEHDFDLVDHVVQEAFSVWVVWRLYGDDQYIGPLMDRWIARWGKHRVVIWHTNRPRPMAWAVRDYLDAIASGNELHHDGDPRMRKHIAQARKRMLTVLDDREHQMFALAKDFASSPRKIDAAIAGVVSWEARSDCISLGAVDPDPPPKLATGLPIRQYEADYAPSVGVLTGAGDHDRGPMSI